MTGKTFLNGQGRCHQGGTFMQELGRIRTEGASSLQEGRPRQAQRPQDMENLVASGN